MALFQTSITLWLLFILINGALVLGTSFAEQVCQEKQAINSNYECGHVTVLQGAGLTQNNTLLKDLQNYDDQTNTLFGNFTSAQNVTILNHTGDNNVLDPIYDAGDIPFFMYWDLANSLLNICPVCNTIDAFAISLGFDTDGDGNIDNVAFQGMTFAIVAGLAITNILAVLFLVGGRAI